MYFRKLQRDVFMGYFVWRLLSFILAERGKNEKFYTVNTSGKETKKKGGLIYSVQMKANLNHSTFVIQF